MRTLDIVVILTYLATVMTVGFAAKGREGVT